MLKKIILKNAQKKTIDRSHRLNKRLLLIQWYQQGVQELSNWNDSNRNESGIKINPFSDSNKTAMK